MVLAETDSPVQRRAISLDEAITLARVQSVDAAVALNELKTAYWEYRTFRADLLPEINFSANLPSYNKNYNSYPFVQQELQLLPAGGRFIYICQKQLYADERTAFHRPEHLVYGR